MATRTPSRPAIQRPRRCPTPEAFYARLGRNLAATRARVDVTRADLADATGHYSAGALVAAEEAGRPLPELTLEHLAAMGALLDVDPADLLA